MRGYSYNAGLAEIPAHLTPCLVPHITTTKITDFVGDTGYVAVCSPHTSVTPENQGRSLGGDKQKVTNCSGQSAPGSFQALRPHAQQESGRLLRTVPKGGPQQEELSFLTLLTLGDLVPAAWSTRHLRDQRWGSHRGFAGSCPSNSAAVLHATP